MSDTKSGDDKTLSVTPKKTLTLKRPGVEQSTVRQNFSHGRTKQVVVETKRKFVKPGERPEPPSEPMSADRVRWEHIQRVYELCDRNVSETARRLKMHRRTLQRILAKRSPR